MTPPKKKVNRSTKKKSEEPTPSAKKKPEIGSSEFMNDILKGVKDLYQMFADKYTGGNINKLLPHFGMAVSVPAGDAGSIEILGKKIGTKQKLGGAIVGNGELMIVIAACIVRSLAETRSEHTGQSTSAAQMNVMSEIMDRVGNITDAGGKSSFSEDDPPTFGNDDGEGLKSHATMRSITDMVKDLGIEDIQNLLG